MLQAVSLCLHERGHKLICWAIAVGFMHVPYRNVLISA